MPRRRWSSGRPGKVSRFGGRSDKDRQLLLYDDYITIAKLERPPFAGVECVVGSADCLKCGPQASGAPTRPPGWQADLPEGQMSRQPSDLVSGAPGPSSKLFLPDASLARGAQAHDRSSYLVQRSSGIGRKSERLLTDSFTSQPETRNRLLRAIPLDERLRVLAVASEVRLQARQILHHCNLPMNHIYFVEEGVVSVAAKVGSEQFVEVWLVGSDGIVGALLLLTEDSVPPHRRIVRVGGRALQIPVAVFRQVLEELPTLRQLVFRYLAVILAQTSQSGACNSVHPLKQRLARWLLLARHALQCDELPLTQKTLANLLGVRRASVTDCIELLQREQFIGTGRGRIVVLDAERLEGICCDCFRLMQRQYDRLIRSVSER